MTDSNTEKIRGLGLCSGGLDSILAALVLKQQGIEVEWVSFETPFFSADKSRKASEMTGIPLTVQSITETYLPMLRNPRCGYGQHMNPCLDCHALMFRLAGEMMQATGFDFLFSGEVLGQRPMSQTRPSLRYVEKNSLFDGYIVRPLSAKRLDPTIPEKQGLIDREQLLDITGRSRKRQIQLAGDFGLKNYPAPGGGCLLTDKGYSTRLKDLFAHQATCMERELELLKYGRHFRLSESTKIVVGRTKQDNENILTCHDPGEDTIIKVEKFPGPTVLMPHAQDRNIITLAGAICAGYSKAPALTQVNVLIETPRGKSRITVIGLAPSDIRHLMI
ncbi:MAG: tRNA 4-thiouridine(8) synthase ThiI [Deltaproteobacteria bacterium]|nr:tRNA 4-thiouridine(8) synthase ThiI [Deltaproteobacteria bacterium]